MQNKRAVGMKCNGGEINAMVVKCNGGEMQWWEVHELPNEAQATKLQSQEKNPLVYCLATHKIMYCYNYNSTLVVGFQAKTSLQGLQHLLPF